MKIIMWLLFFLTTTGGCMALDVKNDGCYNSFFNKEDDVYSLSGDKDSKWCAYYYSDAHNESIKNKEGVIFNIS
ncbi:hypothetical protein PVC88_004012, partial [Cronobacter sakazakii]|nr:hypothetical protein [Cronobacter sakazakii]